MHSKKISIIIVTYNSQRHIVPCLDSIEKFRDIQADQVEIIVVDNSSGDDAAEIKEMVESHSSAKLMKVLYLHNAANLGYGQGNNVGIKNSSGEIICVMNPDVRFHSGLLKDVCQKFENSKLALLGYKQLGGFNYSFYCKPEFKTAWSGWMMKVLNRLEYFNPRKHYLSGAFFFIDKEKFMKIGGFDENIFMFFEEPDIARRLQNEDYEIQYDPSKTYDHLMGDRIVFSEGAFTSEMKSLKYYLSKHGLDQKKYLSAVMAEFKIKKVLAKLLGDQKRQQKFQEETALLKTIFAGGSQP